jgi:eukaryotic-like serine/threonine-protein kinase
MDYGARMVASRDREDEHSMTPERSQRVKEILHGALEKQPGERSAYLGEACQTDPSLRRDVESLLSSETAVAEDFLKSVPPDRFGEGVLLGPYEIISLLGAGGMGEVYRARDTRLGRDVALKVIPASYSSDLARRQRFQREARAISALQHPNICTLYDVGHQDGTDYLVMEYLEGEALSSRLTKGPLSIGQVLTHGIEVASALEAANKQNIIHRDLKPGNILITCRGECKVLDFGLAKLEEDDAIMATATELKLVSSPGIVIGTVPYMSPEQARGEALDGRTDIFSLGSVLYEMATGKMAFPGNTSTSIFRAILDSTPCPPSDLNPSLPTRLDEVIGKCLEKDRELRYQSASELRTDLRRLQRDSEPQHSLPGVTSRARFAVKDSARRLRIPARGNVVAALIVFAAAMIFAIYFRGHRVAISDSGPTTLDVHPLTETGMARRATASPDGRYVIYSGRAAGKDELRLVQVATEREVAATLLWPNLESAFLARRELHLFPA